MYPCTPATQRQSTEARRRTRVSVIALLRIEDLIEFSIFAGLRVAGAAKSAVLIQKLLLKPLLARYMIFNHLA